MALFCHPERIDTARCYTGQRVVKLYHADAQNRLFNETQARSQTPRDFMVLFWLVCVWAPNSPN